MKKENKKILKIVYFDEGSAIDYLDIYHGGLLTEKKDKSVTKGTNVNSKVALEAKTGIIFKILKPFVDITATGNIEGSFARIGESVLKTTISNTVLTDYIKIAEKDKNVCKIVNYTVYAYKESISFAKMYSPYLNMIKMEHESINFSKMDETLERSKGYYELVAENEINNKILLRFNIKAFRNNYNLVDLTKMNLTFYAIEVGKMKLSQLNIKNEFKFKEDEEIVTTADILKQKSVNDDNILFYDVILAGIIANE